MATLYRPDGTHEEVPVPATYQEAQRLIGGMVERVCPRAAPDVLFLRDEEGLLKGLPLNEKGCELHGTAVHGQPIVGPIIVISWKEKGAWKWL